MKYPAKKMLALFILLSFSSSSEGFQMIHHERFGWHQQSMTNKFHQENLFGRYQHEVMSKRNEKVTDEGEKINIASSSFEWQTQALHEVEESFRKLQSGSDIRGQFMDDEMLNTQEHTKSKERTVNQLYTASLISKRDVGLPPPLSLLSSFYFGYSFARMIMKMENKSEMENIRICVGRDPRSHGEKLMDYVCRGITSAGAQAIEVGLATTPSMSVFCQKNLCEGGIMITASHLPPDRNGMKFFSRAANGGGLSKKDIADLIDGAISSLGQRDAIDLSNHNIAKNKIKKDLMSIYISTLKSHLLKEIDQEEGTKNDSLPLSGLKIVVNAGNGSAYFVKKLLQDLGADTSNSIGCPDDSFPDGNWMYEENGGVPNPENDKMVEYTKVICGKHKADLGIMFDTDADRCGFIIPSDENERVTYQELNKNRLIALLGCILSKENEKSTATKTVVTDSCTSEGLTEFLEKKGLKHYRYIRGYNNVISKAKQLNLDDANNNAKIAIETSGHCAMEENSWIDDGTFTMVKVVGLLTKLKGGSKEESLFDLIKEMKGEL